MGYENIRLEKGMYLSLIHIWSTPVSVSMVRMLRPSRPIIRPFISSLGSGTTETVASETVSAAVSYTHLDVYKRQGISSLVHSFDLKRFGVSGWGLMTAWGAVEIVFGVVSLFKPVAAVVAMAILIGITFVIEGIKMLITAFYTGRFLR